MPPTYKEQPRCDLFNSLQALERQDLANVQRNYKTNDQETNEQE